MDHRYFELTKKTKNSLKEREFEIGDSKWLKGESKGNDLGFEILEDSK